MLPLDEVIRITAKKEDDLSKDIYHYLMMYRYLLRKQAEAEENLRNAKRAGIMSKVIKGMPEKGRK